MRDLVITLIVGAAMMAASFYAGQRYERSIAAEAAAKAIAREVSIQEKNGEKASNLDDVARCAVLGGVLANGECT